MMVRTYYFCLKPSLVSHLLHPLKGKRKFGQTDKISGTVGFVMSCNALNYVFSIISNVKLDAGQSSKPI